MKSMVRALSLAVVLCASALTFSAGPAAAAPAPGLEDDWIGNDGPAQVDLASRFLPSGNRLGRIFACWCEMENSTPGAGPRVSYNRVLVPYRAMIDKGIAPVIDIIGAPQGYAEPGLCPNAACFAPPTKSHDDEWRDFFTGLARAVPRARAIEVWNEPNLTQFWFGGPNPERYAELLNIARDAIKAVDPNMTVLAPSLSASGVQGAGGLSDQTFLDRFYAANPRFDALSIKLFAGPVEPWTYNVREKLKRIQRIRNSKGDDRKIWVTNLGLSTTGDPTVHAKPTASEQGIGLASAYRNLASYADVEAIIIYRLLDIDASRTPDPWEPGLGIYTDLNSPKPNTEKLKAALTAAPYGEPTVGISTATPVVGINQSATFTATGFPSYPDPLGKVTYQWDTDGNGTPEPSTAGTAATAQRKYTKVGTYKVSVTASDTLEQTSNSVTITVQTAPVAGVDKIAPKITTLTASPFAFRAARSGPSIAAARTGTTVRFVADEQGVATKFTFHRIYPGRIVGKKCRRETRSNRRGKKRCSYYAAIPGFVNRYTKKGVNTFRFTGRVRNRTLARARYRMTARATDTSKNVGKAKTTLFKVI